MNNVVGAAMQAAGLSPGAIAGTMNGALAAAGMPALSPALTTGGVPANVVAESPVVLQKSMVLALFNVCGPQNPSHTREYVSLPLPTLHDLRSAMRCGRMHTALTARLRVQFKTIEEDVKDECMQIGKGVRTFWLIYVHRSTQGRCLR